MLIKIYIPIDFGIFR